MHDKLSFNPQNHEYRWGDRVVPSVTHVLKILYDFKFAGHEGMERGTYVHLACELYDKNELDVDELDPGLFPYVDAWGKWLESKGLFDANALIETPLFSQRYQYAGMLDRTFIEEKLLVDIKTGAPAPTYKLQLMAYRQLVDENLGVKPDLLEVRLTPDGEFKETVHKFSRSDFNIFLSALTVYKFRQKIKGE